MVYGLQVDRCVPASGVHFPGGRCSSTGGDGDDLYADEKEDDQHGGHKDNRRE
jgi:hypothetical protein